MADAPEKEAKKTSPEVEKFKEIAYLGGIIILIIAAWIAKVDTKSTRNIIIGPKATDQNGQKISEKIERSGGGSAGFGPGNRTGSFLPRYPGDSIVSTGGSGSAGSGSGRNGSAGGSNTSGPTLDPKIYSKYYGKVDLRRSSNSYDDSSKDEYLYIQNTTDKEKINITGWTVTSTSTGRTGLIKKGVGLPFQSTQNAEENIILGGREGAYLITARAPLGYSFRNNSCMPYFEEQYDFSPNIGYSCPNLSRATFPKSASIGEDCQDYVESFSSCSTQTRKNLPDKLNDECKDFIIQESTYNRCVLWNKNQDDFFGDDWWIYFNRDQALWKNRKETIELRDSLGKLVDKTSY